MSNGGMDDRETSDGEMSDGGMSDGGIGNWGYSDWEVGKHNWGTSELRTTNRGKGMGGMRNGRGRFRA